MPNIKPKYRIAGTILSFLAKTWRIHISGEMPVSKAIVVFWHGNMLPGWFIFRNLNPIGVVSLSKDGELLSYLLKKWNYNLLRGSSNENSKKLLEEIIEKASNNLIVMTPDGPRGPIYKMKAGAVVAAQRADVPIILCGIHAQNVKIFSKSWDKFMLPLPFAKVKIALSKSKLISKDWNRDDMTLIITELEKELNTL